MKHMYYVGTATDKDTETVSIVSIAKTRQRAGDLAEKWVDNYATTPKGEKHCETGVAMVNPAYVDLS